MENLLHKILGGIQDLKEDMRILKAEQLIMKGDLQTLKQEQQTMKSDLQTLKEEQQTMKSDLQTLKEEQQTVKAMLSSHGDHIHQLLQIVAATNAYTEELKEDMAEVTAVQFSHERILEHLSLRSLTHEVDIADLARIRQA